MMKYQNFIRGNKNKKVTHENDLSCDAKTSFAIDLENYEILRAGKVLTDPVDLQSRLVNARVALEHEALELLKDRLEFVCSWIREMFYVIPRIFLCLLTDKMLHVKVLHLLIDYYRHFEGLVRHFVFLSNKTFFFVFFLSLASRSSVENRMNRRDNKMSSCGSEVLEHPWVVADVNDVTLG